MDELGKLADRNQVRASGKKEKRVRDQEIKDTQTILATVEGRRFVWRYLGECGVFRSSFTGSSETFFREGERNIGLKLLTDVEEASPEALVLMMKEKKENENV